MDSGFTWLVAAGVCIWTGLGAWVAFLAVRQAQLAKRIGRMESLQNDSE